jgi:hypothetical protein
MNILGLLYTGTGYQVEPELVKHCIVIGIGFLLALGNGTGSRSHDNGQEFGSGVETSHTEGIAYRMEGRIGDGYE